MSNPVLEWSLRGRPPSTPVDPPPAEPVLAVGDQVTVTANGSTFEATITAVTPATSSTPTDDQAGLADG
ncbi:hypothetical protein VA596_49965 [Amycolatopsis sp., V23-08]|uniref:Uncharacterized protein n=1 Tax=Amycolatopsis heterodermiae TaxID=3110235 RepID=A0ABU5RN45_9PSEU|nr:hypothetical protein [Amycolatopsis sp., V23-08]MEA5367738.1 hypothetical protein [Amycolatopsis sp., V23-08]